MKASFAYLEQVAAKGSLRERCFSAASIVAITWGLVGTSIRMFFSHLPEGSLLHERLRVVSLGCILIAPGIYSLLIPFHIILRDRKD